MTSRRSLLFASLATGLVAFLPRLSRADEATQPTAFVSSLAQDAIQVMTGPGLSDAERINRFRTLFIGAVDLPTLGRFVLARHWRTATPDQQRQFLHLFEEMLVLTWSNRFKDAGGKINLRVDGAKPDGDQGVWVETHILRDNQEPVAIIWRLRQIDGAWRIIDLTVEGTSMAFTYRDEYASVINQSGGQIEGLLSAMSKKVDQLSQAVPAQP
jgi:phospholipid transport system substrate-binding protein